MMFGFTGSYRRVRSPLRPFKVNAVCRVKLGAMDETHDLLGKFWINHYIVGMEI
ncbi:MAG: hypothetical protein ACLRMJ_01795 [Alistipes finegoldii]